MELNDPILVKLRARKQQRQASTGKQMTIPNLFELSALKVQLRELQFEMEQSAEPEGGEIADYYGREIEKVENRINQLESL